jgi:4-amino-4-deoxy-L-arabinose transferase-like glycosyltransferase
MTGKSKKLLPLLAILIIAIFFRFYQIKAVPPGLYPDEAMDGNNALEVLRTGHFQSFYTEDNGREGLYVNILVPFIRFFGNEPWVVRLPAAIAGVLTVLGLYFLAAELLGEETGLLAAFLMATSFWHINFSRIGFRAILAPLLLTWAIYFVIKSIKSRAPKRAYAASIFAGVIYGLGFYTYIAYRITPLLFLVFIPFFKREPGFWKRLLVFIAAAFVVALPIGWYFIQHPADFFGRTSQIAVTNSGNPLRDFAVNAAKTALMFNVRGDYNWRHNISGAPELFWPVGILFLIGIIVCLRRIQKWKSAGEASRNSEYGETSGFPIILTFLWIIIAGLPAAASNEGIPHALRSILMLPPAIILAAIGSVWTHKTMKKYWSAVAVKTISIIFIIAVVAFAYIDYFVVWAKNPNVSGAFNDDYVRIGREINNLPKNTSKYVVVEAPGVPVRGIPTPAQTVMFVTDTFLAENQEDKNVHYVLPSQESSIPADAVKFYVK